MRHVAVILICFVFLVGFSFGKKKSPEAEAGRGYVGTLPDISVEFDYKKLNTESKPLFTPNPKASFDKLKPAPLDDVQYLDVVLKKSSVSGYTKDLVEVRKLLEKLKTTIEKDLPIQVFNAQASSLIDNVTYLQQKYKNKPEERFMSYQQLLRTSDAARSVAALRMQSLAYSKYVSYGQGGHAYSPQNIRNEMGYLLKLVDNSISVIKTEN